MAGTFQLSVINPRNEPSLEVAAVVFPARDSEVGSLSFCDAGLKLTKWNNLTGVLKPLRDAASHFQR